MIRPKTIDNRPHQFHAAPTKRLPHRSRCGWCGEYGDVRHTGPELSLCPARGDLEAVVTYKNADGDVEVRMWMARAAPVEPGEVYASLTVFGDTWQWINLRETRVSSHILSWDYLDGFAQALVARAQKRRVTTYTKPPEPLPRNVIEVAFGRRPDGEPS